MKKRTRNILCLIILLLSLAAILIYINNNFTASAEDIDDSPVQVYLDNPSNIVQCPLLTNKKFGITTKEKGYVYFKLPNKNIDSRLIEDNYAFNFSNDGLYVIFRFSPISNPNAFVNLNIEITIDYTAPEINLFSSEILVENFSFVSDDINASAIDNLSGIKTFEVSKFNSDFMPYNGETLTEDADYTFLAVDNASNERVANITKDTVSPIIKVYAEGLLLNNNITVNSPYIEIGAIDELSGIKELFIKHPNTNNFTTYTQSTISFSESGKYEIYAKDRSGNLSETFIVSVDNIPPVVSITHEGKLLSNGACINGNLITFHLDKANATGYVYSSLSDSTSEVINGATFTIENRYSFYAIDSLGNRSQDIIITIDRTAPSGTLYIDDLTAENGTYTNKNFSYNSTDYLSGIDFCEIKKPDSSWKLYIPKDTIDNSSPNGKYIFRSFDKSGNASVESIIYLYTVSPTGSLFADNIKVDSGTYTNASHIKFISEVHDLATCYVKLPNTMNYIATSSGAIYSAVGKYEFYAVDISSNESDIYIITIDRTPKTVTLEGVINNSTNQNVKLNWSNTKDLAPISSITVNGKTVANNVIISTINGGRYKIECTDVANNYWSFVFTAERTDIETTTINQFWWEAKDSNGKTYSFETYEKALAFAEQREKALIKTLTWSNSTWDTGYIMDSIDSVNAKQGNFYLYKKHDNPKVEVAYFTLGRLNAVKKYYAEQEINQYYYWEKNPAESYSDNDLNKPVTSGTIIATNLSLRSELMYKIDGITLSATSYKVEGKHILTVYDEFGNSYSYNLIIVSNVPDLQYCYNNGNYYFATNNQIYNLLNSFTIKPVDEFDEFVMAIILNEKNERLFKVNYNEELTISKPGKYTIRVINHYGYKDYDFILSVNSLDISATTDVANKLFTATVEPSNDVGVNLLEIRIYYSINGIEWILLSIDDRGNAINTTNLNYTFSTQGYYKIIVEDTHRNGINAIVFEENFCLDIDAISPTLELIGVENGGKTKSKVSLINLSEEATIQAYFNGEEFNYKLGETLSEVGIYRFVATDSEGNFSEYTFEIIYSVNSAGTVFIVLIIAAVLAAVLVFLIKKRIIKINFKRNRKIRN